MMKMIKRLVFSDPGKYIIEDIKKQKKYNMLFKKYKNNLILKYIFFILIQSNHKKIFKNYHICFRIYFFD